RPQSIGNAERHPLGEGAAEEEEGRGVADRHGDEPDLALQCGARTQARRAGDFAEDRQRQPQPTHSVTSAPTVSDASGVPDSTRMTPMMMRAMPMMAPILRSSPKNTMPSTATRAPPLADHVA